MTQVGAGLHLGRTLRAPDEFLKSRRLGPAPPDEGSSGAWHPDPRAFKKQPGNRCLDKSLCTHAPSSRSDDSQMAETTQTFFNGWMGTHHAADLDGGILFGHKEEGRPDSRYDVDEPQTHCVG